MSDTGDGRRSERDAATAEEERRRQAMLAMALGSHNLPPRDVPPPGETPPAHPALDRVLRLTTTGIDLRTYALWIVIAIAIALVYWLS